MNQKNQICPLCGNILEKIESSECADYKYVGTEVPITNVRFACKKCDSFY